MCVIVNVGDWVDKYALSLRKRKNDRVILRAENNGLLAVDDAGSFVPILGEGHFHVFLWEDRVGLHC